MLVVLGDDGLAGPGRVFCWSVDSVAAQSVAQARMERPPVRILVVVANIQGRILKTEVEKGSV